MQHSQWLAAMAQQRDIVAPPMAHALQTVAAKAADVVRILGLPPTPVAQAARVTRAQMLAQLQAMHDSARLAAAHAVHRDEQPQLETAATDADYAHTNYQRRLALFRRVLDALLARARYHATRRMWEERPAGAQARIQPRPQVIAAAEDEEATGFRMLLALTAQETLNDAAGTGHPTRADAAGATADELRLLRICAEVGMTAAEMSFDDFQALVAVAPAPGQS